MKRTSGIILSLLLFLSLSLPAQERDRTELEQALRTLVERKRAETGIAVILNGTDTVTVNDAGRYPMMSVFKFHQALAVADFLDRNGLPLSTPLPIRESDLLPDTYSPLRDAYPQGGIEMSIGELLVYTLQLSDNNACDLLFRYIGGPTAADRYIRTLGIEGFAVEATEEEMHRDLTACYRNWSHPLDAARLLEMLITRPPVPGRLPAGVHHPNHDGMQYGTGTAAETAGRHGSGYRPQDRQRRPEQHRSPHRNE